jgi:hypothetical protein
MTSTAGEAEAGKDTTTGDRGANGWPSLQTVVGGGAVAAIVVAIDAYFSAQAGDLAQPPNYEGVGYMQFARTAFFLLRDMQLRQALHEINSIAPLWTLLQTFQYLVLGDGTWQVFAVRFWPVALLLILVYWVVRARATRAAAIAAMALTAVSPMVSVGVRASSWELLTGHSDYGESWGLDDLGPDFLAGVLVLWSVASLAEGSRSPRRSTFIVSAAFAAAAVLTKPSTAPFALAAWGVALSLMWLWRPGVRSVRMVALGMAVLLVLLAPWGILGRGVVTTLDRLREGTVTYGATYFPKVDLGESVTYYLLRLPNQLGQLEFVFAAAAALVLIVMLVRRHLDRAEVMYAVLIAFLYFALTIPSAKNPKLGEWISMSVWTFVLAGISRVAVLRWPSRINGYSRALLASVGVYVLLVYVAGVLALANWPQPERQSNAQLTAATNGIVDELRRRIQPFDCFTYAPGPGWPASIEYQLMDSEGRAPSNNPIDVSPDTSIDAYVQQARQCRAVIVYRDDIRQVARVFYCPPVRQPYLQALSDWVRSPGSGYILDRTWTLSNVLPRGPHPLGRDDGVSLTVELYLR